MAAKFVSVAEAELACPVCFQFYVSPHDPKNLPNCSHILCQICMQKMVEGGLKNIKCPQCNKVSTLSKKGVDGLTTSLVVRNLAEQHPEGIKQRKEYMLDTFHQEKELAIEELENMKESQRKMQISIEHEQREIEKSVEEVMTKAQELVRQIKDSSGLVQIQQQVAQLETKVKNLQASQSKLELMTNEEFHAQTDALTNQIEKLKIDKAPDNTKKDSCVGKFIANVQLGRIVKPRRLVLVQEFGEFKGATGIASNPNGLLAVCDAVSTPKQVTVFQNDNSHYERQFKFSVTSDDEEVPLDAAISNEGKYLVAKCGAGFDVHSLDGKCEKTVRVIDPKPGQQKLRERTYSITSTKDGRILTGSAIRAKHAKEESAKPVVTVHNTRGELLKTIPIRNIEPSRITDINGTHVAVSDAQDTLCVYDLQSGKETLALNIPMPVGICYDEQSDCLLIGRGTERNEDGNLVLGSCVLEQYCSMTGKLVACLAHRLKAPAGITITGDNMLAVTDNKTVKVYKMKLNL